MRTFFYHLPEPEQTMWTLRLVQMVSIWEVSHTMDRKKIHPAMSRFRQNGNSFLILFSSYTMSNEFFVVFVLVFSGICSEDDRNDLNPLFNLKKPGQATHFLLPQKIRIPEKILQMFQGYICFIITKQNGA